MRRLLVVLFALAAFTNAQDREVVGTPGDGFRGIWYANQSSGDEYVFKYSGGLGTYCAKHQPFAVYSAAANKTFFCYGGTRADGERKLVHMVSYFDHATGKVARPTLLLDKETSDAHDNPVIALDDDGRIWIFSTSHGRSRPSFVHRSVEPFDVSAFERVAAMWRDENDAEQPLDNFSYMQAWHLPELGFACFFTRYGDPAARTSMFMTSVDGVHWSRRQRLAAIEEGHYQISVASPTKVATAFNFHPKGQGLNWRANLYYLESVDLGEHWQGAAGDSIEVPVTARDSESLVYDSRQDGLLVYLKDIRFDAEDHPAILFLTSRGYASGPKNGPRTWRFARWTGEAWRIHAVCTSDNNYDMGSLYRGARDGEWRVIAPTEPGPQPYNPGGEIAVWESADDGRTWERGKVLTSDSPRNHTYVRRPVDAHADFLALWADGDARAVSASRLYFCNAAGEVFRLPVAMAGREGDPFPLSRR